MGALYEVYTELGKLLKERNQYKIEVEILEKEVANLKGGVKQLGRLADKYRVDYLAERQEREMLQEQMSQMSHQIDLLKESNDKLHSTNTILRMKGLTYNEYAKANGGK